jgi:hypothetical protein
MKQTTVFTDLLWAVGMPHIFYSLGRLPHTTTKEAFSSPIPSSHEEWWPKRTTITLLMQMGTLPQSLGLRGCPFELIHGLILTRERVDLPCQAARCGHRT